MPSLKELTANTQILNQTVQTQKNVFVHFNYQYFLNILVLFGFWSLEEARQGIIAITSTIFILLLNFWQNLKGALIMMWDSVLTI